MTANMREGSPAPAGVNYAKPHLLTDSFQIPTRSGNKKKSTSQTKHTKKPATPKEPRQKISPLTLEEKREKQRLRDYAIRENSKAVGLCTKSNCEERAIPGQTRCEAHAEEHRVSRRESDRERRAGTKKSKGADSSTNQRTVSASKPLDGTPPTEIDGKLVHETPDKQTSAQKQPKNRQEIQRRSRKKWRTNRVAQGICVDSGPDNHNAAEGRTRCDDCAEVHRVSRRASDALRRAKTKADQEPKESV